jgi:hypothetical protein
MSSIVQLKSKWDRAGQLREERVTSVTPTLVPGDAGSGVGARWPGRSK